MKLGKFTAKEKARYRKKGYIIHTCWKCGVEFVGVEKPTYLPGKKEYHHVCPRCRRRMGLQ